MPSRAYTSFLHKRCWWSLSLQRSVSMPSRAYTSFLPSGETRRWWEGKSRVNALSGLYLISTQHQRAMRKNKPLLVSMPSRAYTSFLLKQVISKCITTQKSVNALSGLYLISTVPLQKPRFYAVFRACFCRYLSEYSDNSCFSCMLTFWTYLMRCTYPWH